VPGAIHTMPSRFQANHLQVMLVNPAYKYKETIMSITRINEFQAAEGKAEELFGFLKSLLPCLTLQISKMNI